MTTKAQVHALPTERVSSLSAMLLKADSGQWHYEKVHSQEIAEVVQPHHIYFTTDEEPKDDEWCIMDGGLGRKGPMQYQSNVKWSVRPLKIVATTNPELSYLKPVYDRNEQHTEDVWADLPKIGEDFIQAFVREQGNINDVLLEMEEAFFYTQGRISIRTGPYEKLKLRSNGTVIIHPEKKLYTESEMWSNMQYYMEYCQHNGYVTPHDWLTKHKHF